MDTLFVVILLVDAIHGILKHYLVQFSGHDCFTPGVLFVEGNYYGLFVFEQDLLGERFI
jgi:hypothetical protein